jgi:predicted XRE-type DNA-binding protein
LAELKNMNEAKAPERTKSKPRIAKGSANIFADLGLPNPEQELIKARLALQIYRIIRQRGMTQSQAASALGIKQPHVSLLMRNRAGSFSVGRLLELLTRLGQDVEVTVRPTRREHGEMSVTLG